MWVQFPKPLGPLAFVSTQIIKRQGRCSRPTARIYTPKWRHNELADLTLPLYPEDIRTLLPHRYPFLLVDRVTQLIPGRRAIGYKMVTANEPHFNGHFPEYNLMPGVLIIEALAQLGGIAVMALPEMAGRRPMMAGLDEARFRGQVRPGDKLEMDVTIDKLRGSMGKGSGVAKVDGNVVCEGKLLFALG
jgi:3-hydroxyacyl-[acyl-carrier-protein] dehydratase